MLPYVLSAISIIGGFFNAYGKRISFYIWLITDISWLIYCIHIKFWGQVPMWAVWTIVSILGIIKFKER